MCLLSLFLNSLILFSLDYLFRQSIRVNLVCVCVCVCVWVWVWVCNSIQKHTKMRQLSTCTSYLLYPQHHKNLTFASYLYLKPTPMVLSLALKILLCLCCSMIRLLSMAADSLVSTRTSSLYILSAVDVT